MSIATRWLSDQVFTLHATAAGIVADSSFVNFPLPTDYQVWVERWHNMLYVSATATWVATLVTLDFESDAASVATKSTDGQTGAKFYHYTDAIGVAVDGTGGNTANAIVGLGINYDEQTGTTTLYGGTIVEYRLIAT